MYCRPFSELQTDWCIQLEDWDWLEGSSSMHGLNPQTQSIHLSRPNSGKDQKTQRPYLGPSHLWGKDCFCKDTNKQNMAPLVNLSGKLQHLSTHLQYVLGHRHNNNALFMGTSQLNLSLKSNMQSWAEQEIFWGFIIPKEDMLACWHQSNDPFLRNVSLKAY